MALTKQVETKCGITLQNAYLKIVDQGGNKENINIRLAIYKDMDACLQEKDFISQEIYSFIPTLDDNFIKQGYEYLKTLPEFADSADC